MFLLGILIFKGLTARPLYKSFGVKGLILGETNLFSAVQPCCVGCHTVFPVVQHGPLLAGQSNIIQWRAVLYTFIITVLICCTFTLSKAEDEKVSKKERKNKFSAGYITLRLRCSYSGLRLKGFNIIYLCIFLYNQAVSIWDHIQSADSWMTRIMSSAGCITNRSCGLT
jgi:hypothetical protein